MFNTNFNAMKKLSYLLLLMSLFLQPVSANTNNTGQKIDLRPKIKQGDEWKMVVDIGALDFKWNNAEESDSIKLLFGKFMGYNNSNAKTMGFDNSNAKSEWNVSCLESTKEKMILQYTLERFVNESHMMSLNLDYLIYNDTDYPLTLTQENIDNIKSIIGKRIILEIPWNPDSTINKLRNDFKDDNVIFPTLTFQNHRAPKNIFMSFSGNQYVGLASEVLTVLVTQWRNSLPKSTVGVGEAWRAKFGIGEEAVELIYKLSRLTERNAFVTVKGEKEVQEIVINRQNGWRSFPENTDPIGLFSYNMPHPNTHIRGDFNDSTLNGEALFEIEYPIGYEEQQVDVTHGKFELQLDLKEGITGKLIFKDKGWDLFLSPEMDVDIKWNGNGFVASGYGSEDINCLAQLSLKSYILEYTTNYYSKEQIANMKKRYETRVDSIVSGFNNSISYNCRNFIRTEVKYRMASWFNRALSRIEFEKTTRFAEDIPNDMNRLYENEKYLHNYMDTLQVNGAYSLSSHAYHSFIREHLEFEQKAFLTQKGRRYSTNNFAENILFAGIQYVGYPYFYAVYDILKSEIIKGNGDLIQKELNDFYSFPCSSVLKNKLRKEAEEMLPLKAGNPFPYPEITDIDGVVRKLPKGELCIVDFKEWYSRKDPQHKDELEELTRILKVDDRIDKINYVVVRPVSSKGKMIEASSNDTVNFTYIYLPEKDLSRFKSLKIIDRKRNFLLDENLEIIHNNIEEIGNYTGHKLRQILDKYFESQNQPTSKADNSRLLLVILVSLIGFGLLSWFVIRLRTKQIQKKEATRRKLSELELKAIRSQMNPHFIFNAMGSIQNLINQNKAKNANLYLSRFARLMRMVLSNSNKRLVSLSDEIELLKHYLELEQLRIDFKFTISLSDNIDPETEEIPGMLVQPFVENAVIHGITPKGKGNVWVRFSKDEDTLVCEIIDDGVGINTSAAGNGSGVAMKLAAKRLDLLNSQLQSPLRLTVENRMEKEKTEGTKITLLIPVG